MQPEHRVLDQLTCEERCLGAFFTSYTFDPVFFEHHVLRAVLQLSSDPEEQVDRYHQEARRRLQEVPVVAIVDAGHRGPGRRLPYDLLEVSQAVFHPKSVLLLYERRARLLVGSGNLTANGYGGNAELFFCTDLFYSDAAHAATLSAYCGHLDRVLTMARQRGTQVELIRSTLSRRLRVAKETPPQEFALLDSTAGSLSSQIRALLPAEASILSVAMLAPFYERDGTVDTPDSSSVFSMLEGFDTKKAAFEIGLAWENPRLHPGESQPLELEDGLGRIWTYKTQDGTLEHCVPVAIRNNKVVWFDAKPERKQWTMADACKAISDGRLWIQPKPEVYGPRTAIEGQAERTVVRRWLHPDCRLIEERVQHRPLHAKLLAINFQSGSEKGCVLVMGSPNMSRRALLMRAGEGGNVELAVGLRFARSFCLNDLVPGLVAVPATAFEPAERKFPEAEANHGLAVEQALHDPEASTLHVTWSSNASRLGDWEFLYTGRRIAGGAKAPRDSVIVADFVLSPQSAELTLRTAGKDYAVPILVTDLVKLPASSDTPSMGLRELLQLLTRRIGEERAVQIAKKRTRKGGAPDLAHFFEEDFCATDVYRAWWTLAQDLSEPALSVQGFRLNLTGALGASAAWKALMQAMRERHLSTQETWLYGAELLRTFADIQLPADEDADEKKQALTDFRTSVQRDLASLLNECDATTAPGWLQAIQNFYAEAVDA